MQMRTTGPLSRGIRIGLETGFDSGRSLDYVYANRAQGTSALGRVVDRIYLNAIGWRGIRIRKVHLQRMVRRAIELARESGRPVHVADIASGPGRYLLEVLRELPAEAQVRATLRDCKQEELDAAQRVAEGLGLRWAARGFTDQPSLSAREAASGARPAPLVSLEIGDAFSFDSLRSMNPPADVAVVSGLYELFGDNDRVLTSLRGLADASREGGYLVYTNQPWHPQVEMIARVLKNRDGKAWVMRRRTQEEMDQLVRSAGFRKLDMLIDPFGIFTVSLAQREGSAHEG
jgi:hypothetical protein